MSYLLLEGESVTHACKGLCSCTCRPVSVSTFPHTSRHRCVRFYLQGTITQHTEHRKQACLSHLIQHSTNDLHTYLLASDSLELLA